ncbi:MAG: succinylglutamate desuccinylase/aspartoacylase family protein [Candidatus Rokubacteria bacterium]|nr:succinylglutamate desuccinylase/aspartoacylase family protein [Candidatus Rokubacteria bacterium]
MATGSRIFTDIDYEKSGMQVGWLNLPHSVTRAAYRNIMIPIAVVKNGAGPTALLMAGNHGDEYEGQVALTKFIRQVEASDLNGRIILLPAANLAAALNGTRVSPIDQGNLNRVFPGDPNGTPTEQIAYYIDSVLFPMTDVLADFHSGGASQDFLPSAGVNTISTATAEVIERSVATMKALGAPISLNLGQGQDTRIIAHAAMRRGVAAVSGEFGGGGSVSVDGVRLVEQCIKNLLGYCGIVGEPARENPPTRLMIVPGPEYFVFAQESGLFEPFAELGETVEAGQPCGQVLFVDNPAREPVKAVFQRGGLVVCKRHCGRVERGDCVAHLAIDWEG